jgi:hypothetical protein
MSFLDMCKNKKVLFTGHVDLDGVISTILGIHYIKPLAKEFETINTKEYDLCDQKNLDIIINYYDVFIFTDFSPTSELYLKIKEVGKDIYIFDHHVSSNVELKNIALENYYYDITRCGTKIFLDEIAKCVRIKKVIWQTVELVNIYDLYQMKSSLWRDAKGLSNILWAECNWDKTVEGTTKYINFIRSILYKFDNFSVFCFSDYEKKCMDNAEKKEQANLKEAKRNLQIRKDGHGNTYGYFECTSKQSIVSNYILQEREDLKYIISHVTWGEQDGKVTPKVSIRSVEGRGVDCSVMATLWGAGGHVLAAGVEFKNFGDFEKLRKGEIHLI